MKSLDRHRNIGISAHIDSGKTTLTERIRYYCGRIHRMQEVKGGDGGATMDYMDLERERGITITSASTQVEWEDHSINVIDTPGHVDFTVEVERSTAGSRRRPCSSPCASPVGGVLSSRSTAGSIAQMKRYGVPRIAFINKVDRIGANPASVIEQIQQKLGVTPLALQIPMGLSSEFAGVIDLVEMQAVYFDGEQGEDIRREAIPAEYAEEAAKARAHMLETLSLYSDDLMVALLEERPVTTAEIRPIIREATLSQELTPVMMGTAFRNKGVQELLDAVIAYLPNPQDRKIEAIDLTVKPEAGEAAVSTAHGAKSVKKPLTSSSDDPLVAMAFKTVVETFEDNSPISGCIRARFKKAKATPTSGPARKCGSDDWSGCTPTSAKTLTWPKRATSSPSSASTAPRAIRSAARASMWLWRASSCPSPSSACRLNL